MIEVGFDFTNVVIFIDGSFARNAAEYIFEVYGVRLNFKYCTVHISRNLCDFLGIPYDSDLNGLVFMLQGSLNSSQYIHVLDRIKETYGCRAYMYLASIHPVNWCVFANTPHPSTVEVLRNLIAQRPEIGSKDIYIGFPMSLYSTRSTNAFEGENNGLLINNVRDSLPAPAIKLTIMRFSSQVVLASKTANDLFIKNIILTKYAVTQIESRKDLSRSLNAITTCIHDSKSVKFVVGKHSFKDQTHNVTYSDDGGSCKCANYMHNFYPCEHARAVSSQNPDIKLIKFVDPLYLSETLLRAYSGMSISVPTGPHLCDNSTLSSCIYRQAGRPRTRRFGSKGEKLSGTKTSKAKLQRKCSNCLSSDHNRRTCKLVLGVDNEEHGLAFGQVIVGHSIILDDPTLPSPSYFTRLKMTFHMIKNMKTWLGTLLTTHLVWIMLHSMVLWIHPIFFYNFQAVTKAVMKTMAVTTKTLSLNFLMISLKLLQHSFFTVIRKLIKQF